MNQIKTGSYKITSMAGEQIKAFIPAPLPPSPPIEWSPILMDHQQAAAMALGRLDAISLLLPEPTLFLYSYVRQEAVLSSQIEGTQSSLSDLLTFENAEMPGVPLDDVTEVSNYVAALEHGLKRLKEGFPLCLRLIREIHEKLLSRGRGNNKQPGEFRRTQNWIGGSRPGNAYFVPPPPLALDDCLKQFEKFLHHDPKGFPTILKAALAHVQFETIHPFLDGNGRVGRLLISLLMVCEGVLNQPLLYLSLYFKTHRSKYYDLLQKVRVDGDWEAWLDFFFTGVEVTSHQAVNTAKVLLGIFQVDREKINSLKRGAATALRVHEILQKYPVISPQRLAKTINVTPATSNSALENLAKLNIVKETTGRQRNRIFAYTAYLKAMNVGVG